MEWPGQHKLFKAGVLAFSVIGVVSAGGYATKIAILPLLSVKPITYDQVKNSTIEVPIEYSKPQLVKLNNGVFFDAKNGDVSSLEITGPAAFGDINHGGGNGIVTVVKQECGCSGDVVSLVAFINHHGTPKQAAFLVLEDRADVKNISVKDGTIVVDLLRHMPDDAMCDPTLRVTEVYTLQGGKLVPSIEMNTAARTIAINKLENEKLGEEIQVGLIPKDPVYDYPNWDKEMLHNIRVFINRKTGILTLNFSGKNIVQKSFGLGWAVSADIYFKCMDSLGGNIEEFPTAQHWTFRNQRDTFNVYTQYQESGNTAILHLSRMESDYISRVEICFRYSIVEVGEHSVSPAPQRRQQISEKG
jgi:hypothetical protein